ncbi:hypothetical protein RI129_004733 [Pyrocoelia pectoralis]|uniref:MYND-type domain-containing protein n=1 Tax=Pyrocoelia pectoralis TaxID=417401 RepID=A0AAN7VH86_9COLE
MHSALNNFYYFGICHYCKSTSAELRRCSACKVVAYCSRDHQKLDWHNHRELCKVITFTLVNDEILTNSFEDWVSYRLTIQQKWISLLKRRLQPFECQMWMFPRVCNWCYTKLNLTDCPKCYNAAYCSNEHCISDQVIHKKYCNALKLCMNIDCYLTKFKSYPEVDTKLVISLPELPQDMNELLSRLYLCTEKNGESDIWKSLVSDALCPGSVISYAIQESSCNYTFNHKCVIHLVGAATAEATADWILTSELLLHTFNDINEVLFILIGPEALDMCENFDLCDCCKWKGKKVSLKVYKALYHDVVEMIEKPNMVVALNCGLHEFEERNCDEWYSSIPFMLLPETPFVFTSYTHEEMLKDIKYIKRIIPDVESHIVVSHNNPFASLRPIRDWCTKDIPIFYSNAFITIIKMTFSF